MASRYWVGGNGSWDGTTTHWSATTGGAGGASSPTSSDDVFIDANSGSSPTITVSGGTKNCLSLTFTGAISPIFVFSSDIHIFGNASFISTITHSGAFYFVFSATSTGKTITTNGYIFSGTNTSFDGVGGGWTLQDDVTVSTGSLFLTNGALDTNGKAVSCVTFNGSNTNVRSLTLGASIITVSGGWTFTNGTNLTFSPGTSTIIMTGTASFTGALTYNNVTISGIVTISNINTFNILSVTAGYVLKLTSATNQTVNSFIANGTPSNLITIQSVTAGSAATITKTSGKVVFRKCTIKDITATGGATFNAIAGSVSTSGNTGITFGGSILTGRVAVNSLPSSLYWIDSTGTLQKVSG